MRRLTIRFLEWLLSHLYEERWNQWRNTRIDWGHTPIHDYTDEEISKWR